MCLGKKRLGQRKNRSGNNWCFVVINYGNPQGNSCFIESVQSDLNDLFFDF